MINTSLFELRCDTCHRAVGIAEHGQMPVLRRDVAIAHWGHALVDVPFQAATVNSQNVAAQLVRQREGLLVYKTDIPS